MNGFLLVDKPAGWTSFDAVNYVRSIVARAEGKKSRQVKVGHTGTLDPAATGLLVLCIGNYTKKVPELIKHDKTYEAEIMLGATSTTGDREGLLTATEGLETVGRRLNREAVEETLTKFVGEIQQVPPKFSALKVNGKRAYELARAGKEVQLEPRTVTVHSLELVEYDWPKLKVVCSVSSGTYIRTLAEDIGESLQVGGYLSDLRRTVVDRWSIQQAYDPKSITIDNIMERLLA